MGMMNLNDTISAFRCCTQVPPKCSECPLTEMCKWSRNNDACKSEVKLSVNHWLKAQEPRVMTPDEVTNAPVKSVVWLELKPDDVFKNEIYPFVGSGTGWYSCYCSANTSPMFTDEDVEQYGVEFRCWTSCPTGEQRGKVEWRDG